MLTTGQNGDGGSDQESEDEDQNELGSSGYKRAKLSENDFTQHKEHQQDVDLQGIEPPLQTKSDPGQEGDGK